MICDLDIQAIEPVDTSMRELLMRSVQVKAEDLYVKRGNLDFNQFSLCLA